MTTLLITGGQVVDETSVTFADVLVRDGRVQALLQPGHGQTADQVIDATRLHVMPGVVDAHVHFNEPGRSDWEGFVTGTTAAAAGGITTVCDMPLNCQPPTLDAHALAIKRAAIAQHAVVDYALWGGVVPESLELAHPADLQRQGVVGVKAFLCDSGLDEYPPLDEFGLIEAMLQCAHLDLLLALHAEEPTQTYVLGERARAKNRHTALDWAASRPPATELDAVDRALNMAREIGTRVHFVHISTAAAARLIHEAQAGGQDVSCETCPHYLLLDESDLERLGTAGKCAPPIRSRSEVDDLWRALLDGEIDYLASDHSPCPPSMKATDDIWSAWGGIGGIQTLLPAMLSEGVHARGLSLPRLVKLMSANPSRRMGLSPRKGSLQPGSDADIVLVDLEQRWTLAREHLRTRWPNNPFVGRTFHGQVVATLVRGSLVWQNGNTRVEPGFGQLLTP